MQHSLEDFKMSTNASSTNAMTKTKTTTKTTNPLVVVLEEDDEFQEFETATWPTDKEANQEAPQWQDDWDVDDADDDFCKTLRKQLATKSK